MGGKKQDDDSWETLLTITLLMISIVIFGEIVHLLIAALILYIWMYKDVNWFNPKKKRGKK